jgi:hypothetical protein
MERVRIFWTELFRVPWKKRFYGGLFLTVGLLLFIALYRPYSMEGEMGIKIIICPFRNLTGLPCPGCGLTRGVYHLAHGEIAKALSFHILSPLFYVVVILEMVNSIAGIVRRGRPLFLWNDLFDRRLMRYLAYGLILVAVTYNIYRIWMVFHGAPSARAAFSDSIIYRMIHAASSFFAG